MSASDHLSGQQFSKVVTEIPKDMASGYPMRNAGTPRRLAVYDPEAGPSKHRYFADHPGLVGFLDTFEAKDDGYSGKPATHVGFMNTRPDYQGRGIGRQMTEHVVKQAQAKGGSVEWGRIISDQSEHLIRDAKEKFPDVRQYAKY